MKHTLIFVLLVFSLLLHYFAVPQVQGGSAGVGVANVSPEYRQTRITSDHGVMYIDIVVSDYNTWKDIYNITVSITNGGHPTALFIFKNYENTSAFTPIEEFTEHTDSSFLLSDQCSCAYSNNSKTIDDRCLLHVSFAFFPPPGNELTITTADRGGLTATTHVEYSVSETQRGANVIVLPWSSTPIAFSSITRNALAIAAAATFLAILIRKKQYLGRLWKTI